MFMIITCGNESVLKDAMYNKIEQQLKDIHLGRSNAKRIILLVPAQATLKTEEDCFDKLGGDGFFDLLVMSGAKLREEILKETGMYHKTAINTIGRNLILRKLTRENSSSLKSFKTVASEDGFIDMVSDLIVQLKHNKVSAIDMAKAANDIDCSSLLYSKLQDLSLIYGQYENYLADKYSDSDDLISFTSSQVAKSNYIEESIIWYYDFYSFTNNEYVFLTALKNQCIDMNFAILADNGKYKCGLDTASKLSAKLEIGIESISFNKKQKAETRIISCASIYSQSQSIANDILKNVRENKWKFDDFVVLDQNENSRENLKRVFKSMDIPYFMDEKRSFDNSVLASFITNLLTLVVNDCRQTDAISFVKSALLGFDESAIDDFSNYVTQYKVYKKSFFESFKYGKNDSKYNNAESVRSELANLILDFKDRISDAKNAEDYSKALYTYLTDTISVFSKLEAISQTYEKLGMLDAMQEIDQSWDELVALFDQIVELVGNEEMDLEEYSSILLSSIKDINIGVLPQADGKVSIGSVTRSSFSNIKCLYISSFNDGILPSDSSVDSLLTDRELTKISDSGLQLIKSHDLLKDEELFQIERALDSDCEKLTLLYTASDIEGAEQLISPILSKIASDDGIVIEDDINDSDDGLGYLQNKKSSSSKLLQFLKAYLSGQSIPEEWKLCANLLNQDEEFKVFSKALFFNPGAESLDIDTANKVFDKNGSDRVSPSQLEMYAACPFKHFVEYGLHPDKQERFQVDSAKSGTIYHEVLQKVSEKLSGYSIAHGKDLTDVSSLWMSITDEQLSSMVEEILQDIKKEKYEGLLESTPEEEYKFDRIRVLSLVFAKYMVEQLRKGHVSSMYFERRFGIGGQLPPLTIDTKIGKVRIEGVIDRTDIIKNQEHSYAKIIDYKSGSKDFDRERIDLGLDLQLMIYLEAAVEGEKGLEAGGVFYYLVHNPEFEGSFSDVVSGAISEDLEKKLSQKYALEGVVLKNDLVLSSIDTEIVNINNFKTDTIKTHSGKSLLTENEFEKLRTDFRIMLTNLCQNLKSGRIDIKPTIYKGQMPGCEYCNYCSICVKNFAYK